MGVIERQMSNCPAISWQEQVAFNEMTMMSARCTRPTRLVRFYIVLAH